MVLCTSLQKVATMGQSYRLLRNGLRSVASLMQWLRVLLPYPHRCVGVSSRELQRKVFLIPRPSGGDAVRSGRNSVLAEALLPASFKQLLTE